MGLESNFSLSNEVRLSHGTILVFCNGFIELIIFFLFNFIRLPSPNWFRLVTQFPIPSSFVNFLSLWLLLFLLLILLNSPFVVLFLLISFFVSSFLFLIFLYWFFDSFSAGSPKINIKIDELRILLDEVSDSILFKEVVRFLLQIK